MSDPTTTANQPAAVGVGFKWLHLGWGIGSLGAALFLNGINFLLLFFLTTVLHINPAVAGLMMTVGKLWDMAANPAIGLLTDRTETRWGRRRPYLLLGALITSIAFAALFGPPEFGSNAALFAYILVCYLLVSTGYTIFNVPYMAMPAEMFDDYKERSVLMSYRVVFIAIGTLLAGSGGKLIAEAVGGGRHGFAVMGITVGIGIAFFMALACWGTRFGRFTRREATRYTLADQFRTAWDNKPFVVLLFAKFFQLLGLATVGPVILFTFQFVLGREKPGVLLAQYGLINTLIQIITVPIWLRIAGRFEKRGTYMLAAAIFIVGNLTWLATSSTEPLGIFMLRSVVLGFAASGLLLMGQSMLPDVIEYDYRRTGLRREGAFSGLYSFVEKTAFAIAPAIIGFILAAFHFDKLAKVQPPEALRGILMGQAVLPAIYFAVSIAILYFYRLTESRLKGTSLEARKS